MNKLGLFLVFVTIMFPAYQLSMLQGVTDRLALFSQYLGLVALILMAWGQILAVRLPGMETVFGGLDRIYILHKWAGVVAMIAILLHDTIDADMDGFGTETALTDIAETLGEISLYGLLVLVAISVATFIPYHLWKWTHKAMGAFFAAGTLHFFLMLKPFAMTDPIGVYVGVFCGAGLTAYLWMLLPEHLRPSSNYKISKLEPMGDALAITLAPERTGIRPTPGQFGILRFTGAGWDEPHPFSFSKIEDKGIVRVTVKALGDFTTPLRNLLELDQRVDIQGPFGRFRRRGKSPEIWIAAGIGITPFLTWANAVEPNSETVDWFYCIRSLDQAPHLQEITEIADRKANLNLHLIVSSQGDRISAKQIASIVSADLSKTKVSFCGPVSMRRELQTGLRRHGVTPRNFQYEEFEFRTGIGLKRLSQWILDKANR